MPWVNCKRQIHQLEVNSKTPAYAHPQTVAQQKGTLATQTGWGYFYR